MSLGHSAEIQVRRRAPCDAPSSSRLEHGDILVMDGLAQSEYVHRTVPGLSQWLMFLRAFVRTASLRIGGTLCLGG